jgi:hypothetical protein
MRDHDAVVEDLATPDSVRLAPLMRASKTCEPHRTHAAELFGSFEIGWPIGEPEAWPNSFAWCRADYPSRHDGRGRRESRHGDAPFAV